MEGALSEYMFYFKAALNANEILLSIHDMPDTTKEDYFKDFTEQNSKFYNKLKSKDRVNIIRKHKIIVSMALVEQDINQELRNEFGISSAKPRTGYDNILKSIVKELDPIITVVLDYEKESLDLMSELSLSSLRLESVNNKFYFYGTNSIGFTTPYKATIVYDDRFTKNWEWDQDSDLYSDYFKHFGGYVGDKCDSCNICKQECALECEDCNENQCETQCENQCETCLKEKEKYDNQRYRGLLQEVNRYYLSLIKDKSLLISQANQRFHLVSPCNADLNIKITQCECYGNPVEEDWRTRLPPFVRDIMFDIPFYFETGEYNPLLEKQVPNFDGENQMLYALDEKGHIVKECSPQSILDKVPDWVPLPDQQVYTPLCMEINPILSPGAVLDDGEAPNYCYRGIKPASLAAADVALNWLGPTACFAAGSAAATPVVGSIASVVCSVGGKLLYSAYETKCYQWPHHGNTLIC